MLAGLERGALIPADLGYVGCRWFDVSLPLLARSLPQCAARGEDPLDAVVARGRAAGFIRPTRRVSISAPAPTLTHAVAWEAIVVRRTPRYAERRCAPSAPPVPPMSWNW